MSPNHIDPIEGIEALLHRPGGGKGCAGAPNHIDPIEGIEASPCRVSCREPTKPSNDSDPIEGIEAHSKTDLFIIFEFPPNHIDPIEGIEA